jgi:hypothetical protein
MTMEWQPIETAPIETFNKERWFMAHSEPLLLWLGGYITLGSYHYTERGKGRWQNHLGNCKPSHWMPLPPPPKEPQ